jgi:hypothetical protein
LPERSDRIPPKVPITGHPTVFQALSRRRPPHAWEDVRTLLSTPFWQLVWETLSTLIASEHACSPILAGQINLIAPEQYQQRLLDGKTKKRLWSCVETNLNGYYAGYEFGKALTLAAYARALFGVEFDALRDQLSETHGPQLRAEVSMIRIVKGSRFAVLARDWKVAWQDSTNSLGLDTHRWEGLRQQLTGLWHEGSWMEFTRLVACLAVLCPEERSSLLSVNQNVDQLAIETDLYQFANGGLVSGSFHASESPIKVSARRGYIAWRRSAAATLVTPARRSRLSAALRQAARLAGAFPERTWQASSPKVTSRT